MRPLGAVALAICSILFFSGPALAEKRVALVMGNSAYQHVNSLTNPVNDAAAVSATFKNAGFDVVQLRRNLKANEMRRALRDFSDNVRDADVAVVYFAGHGIEIEGVNYLIPVDAVLERDIDAFDEAIPLDRILTVVDPAKQLRLVILDACRDNPFDKTMKRTIAARAIGRGLAKVEPASPNTLIAFAAKAGSIATEGDGANSPFTSALVKYLPRPGLDLRKAFGYVRDDVLKVTNNRQEPFIYGSLGGDDFPLVPAVAAPPPAAVDPDLAVRRDYELAERIGTRPVWDSFIKNHPVGFHTDLAKAQRDRLDAEAASATAAQRAKAAADEQQRLVLEGVKTAEQAKAAAQARAAEEARLATEKKRALEEAKVVADAERAKAAAQTKAAEETRIAAEKARAAEEANAAQGRAAAEKQKALEEAKAAAQAKAEADAKIAADNTRGTVAIGQSEKPIGQVAALTPPEHAAETSPKSDKPSAADIPGLLQIELRRVGCKTGAVDNNWNADAQKSLALFNKNAQTRLEIKVASLEALDAVRSKPTRICPLICDRGYKVDRDNCTKIICNAGYEVGDDNICKRIEKATKPAANRAGPPASANPPVVSEANTSNTHHRYGTDHAGSFAKCREISMSSGWSGSEASRYCGRRYSQ